MRLNASVREGFEPPVPFKGTRFSKAAISNLVTSARFERIHKDHDDPIQPSNGHKSDDGQH
jgi:hypothetical protein